MQTPSSNETHPAVPTEPTRPSMVTLIDATVAQAALQRLAMDDSPDDFVVWLESFAK